MIERSKAEEARLAVSRHAADLFCRHGVDGTTGDDIAAASGLSKRTVWRYFRSKEACIEPLFLATELRFVGHLAKWPRSLSIEAYLQATIASFVADEQFVRDGIAVVRIIAMLPKEPALRSSWLMACHQAEAELVPVIADRAKRSPRDFDVKLCTAMIMAAIRVVDEEICSAAVNDGQYYEQAEATAQLAAAIRAASILPICDPVGR
ncbi:TetR/AcrR family transcriptional regulator [Aureimonas glaciei]|jgi:AcrR family transcriptional regulator|uniref:TetR family transcriptional regulator n=1 Tax=Aureimonas glaciei TaxID=1776957 RepID=A0A917DFR0_9HYPH|nr:TetR/AcrR family transcriptional regulator [Aureimonas glaciei]GGD33977.1 TetR family transcriptional regulator [Aureimonas glaciei]